MAVVDMNRLGARVARGDAPAPLASMPERRSYETLSRAYASAALVAAAEACAHAIATKLPAPSRDLNQRMYRRELQARFEEAVADLERAWHRERDQGR